MIEFNQTIEPKLAWQLVSDALTRGNLATGGPCTDEVSARLGHLHDTSSVFLTKSCTDALEFIGLLLEIRPGDEVILPSFTFTSTANAFAMRGARLVFADIDPNTFSMELPEVERLLSSKTRLVVTMAYGGVSRDIREIELLCKRRSVDMIQDNAQGLFAQNHERPLGSFGLASTLSFHQTKNISCGEGGALILNQPDLLEKAELIFDKGTNRKAFLRGEIDKYTWQSVGSSMGLSELLAAVLLAHFEMAESWQEKRQNVWSAYRTHLAQPVTDMGGKLQEVPEHCVPSYHSFPVVLPKQIETTEFIREMKRLGIDVRTHYEPLHLAPASPNRTPLRVTESITPHFVRLPLHPGMSQDDALFVVDKFLQALNS